MHRTSLFLSLTAILTLGPVGLSVAQGEYESELEAEVEDEGLFDYEAQGEWVEDDYGYYDSYYDWDTGDDEWFEDEDYDTSYYEDELEDEGLFDYEAAGPEWAEDDYGYYDADYDWNTDDEWFVDWYGDSDDLFD